MSPDFCEKQENTECKITNKDVAKNPDMLVSLCGVVHSAHPWRFSLLLQGRKLTDKADWAIMWYLGCADVDKCFVLLCFEE